MKMCRACLTAEKDMVAMDTDFVNNFNLLTNLDVKLSYKVPLYTCCSCNNAVKFCTEFREKCILSDLKFKEMLTPNYEPEVFVEESDEYQMKEEFKLEYESDSNMLEDYDGEPETSNEKKTRDETDVLPKKPITTKRLKRKAKKEPMKKSARIAEKESKVDILEQCDVLPKKSTTTKGLKIKAKKEPKTKMKSASIAEKESKADILEHCGICSDTFLDTESLIKHLECHKLDMSCGLCAESFYDFTHLLSHRIVHLPENNKKCHVCLKKVKSAEALELHCITMHKLRGDDGKLICKYCLSPWKCLKKMKRHIRFCHSDVKCICDHCGKVFRQKCILKSHLATHVINKVYKCDLCNFTCKLRSGVSAHKWKHIKGSAKCSNCGKCFANRELKDKHTCKHPSQTICPICGKQGIGFSNLPRHIRRHNAVAKHQCGQCPARFRNGYTLKVHMDRHDGNKTEQCEYCSKKFYCKSALIKHRRIHTGERPYVCKMCDKGFMTNYNLKVHMKVHGLDVIARRPAE